jgi:hypothetical protein
MISLSDLSRCPDIWSQVLIRCEFISVNSTLGVTYTPTGCSSPYCPSTHIHLFVGAFGSQIFRGGWWILLLLWQLAGVVLRYCWVSAAASIRSRMNVGGSSGLGFDWLVSILRNVSDGVSMGVSIGVSAGDSGSGPESGLAGAAADGAGCSLVGGW